MSIGVKLAEARVIPDIETEIVSAVNLLRSKYTYLFTTGGIGPTHDDITAASIAKAFDVPFVENAEARARLADYYTEANLNPARLQMAMMPEGARLIDNPVSAAPGIQMQNVYVMAGVPSIMAAMMDNVAAALQHGPKIHVISINCTIPESILAADLAAIAAQHPQLDIGSYPSFRMGSIGLVLVVRGTDAVALNVAATAIGAMIRQHGGEPLQTES